MSPASVTIHLLGRPRIVRTGGDAHIFRSRKSWALLAYLILEERRLPTRNHFASMLFGDAADPLGALRWSLSEIRRGLGKDGSIGGDPLVLQLSADAVVDVDVVTQGSSTDAVALPGLGAELLNGMSIRGAAAFDSWLVSAQRRLAAASVAILHKAALESLSRGAIDAAIGYAVRAAAINPFDENHYALLVRLYRIAGDDEAAAKQFAAWTATAEDELGASPGPAIIAAMRETGRLAVKPSMR